MTETVTTIKQESVGTRIADSVTYAVPVGVFVGLVIAVLNRFYPDLGADLIGAIGSAFGVIFNILYAIARLLWKKYATQYQWDR